MIIAVTGSSGSIGRELIPFLESLGHNVLKVSSSIVSDGELNFSFDQLKNKSISQYVDILIHLASLNSNLEEEKINLSDEFDVWKCINKNRKKCLSDYRKSKAQFLNAAECLIKSSNICMAQIAQIVGLETQKRFLSETGLLDEQFLELYEMGKPSLPENWNELSMEQISFGQSIGLVPLSFASATAALVNGGYLLEPTLFLRKDEYITNAKLISSDVSEAMRYVMRHVVKSGSGKQADIEGYDVIGITLKLYDSAKSSIKSKQCCAGQDILDAKRVSQKLDIDHKILYYQKNFRKEVIESFIDSYVSGETPIPCVQCNQTVKFRDLYDYAKELKADALVTGHYVLRHEYNGGGTMYRAEDKNRDQSYFLFSTTQKQLDYLRFPLGSINKSETRKIADKLKLNVARKPDSQDICFVPNGNYASVIEKYRPQSFKKGDILDLNGKKLGSHDGIINYTIGQRKGIKISSQEPLYVVDIRAKHNSIIVGPQDCLNINKIYLRNINLLSDTSIFEKDIFIKVRSTGKLLNANATIQKDSAIVEILQNEKGISPGQACVFYSKDDLGERVLGGGWIDKTVNKNLSTQLTSY